MSTSRQIQEVGEEYARLPYFNGFPYVITRVVGCASNLPYRGKVLKGMWIAKHCGGQPKRLPQPTLSASSAHSPNKGVLYERPGQ
jgi:hypothetical protein